MGIVRCTVNRSLVNRNFTVLSISIYYYNILGKKSGGGVPLKSYYYNILGKKVGGCVTEILFKILEHISCYFVISLSTAILIDIILSSPPNLLRIKVLKLVVFLYYRILFTE